MSCMVIWATAKGQASQAGHLVFAAERKILKGEWAKASCLSWRSHKVKRKVASAPAAEVIGMSESLAQGD